jgi:hypothetical protein
MFASTINSQRSTIKGWVVFDLQRCFRFPDFLDVLENLKTYLLPFIGVCTSMVVMDRHSFYSLR